MLATRGISSTRSAIATKGIRSTPPFVLVPPDVAGVCGILVLTTKARGEAQLVGGCLGSLVFTAEATAKLEVIDPCH